MSVVHVAVECAQCGREAPFHRAELAQWRHGHLALDDELDDFAAAMILCPDCDADDRAGDFEPGDAG